MTHAQRPSTETEHARVLVVDDDADARHLVAECLDCVGIASARAPSALDAIALLEAGRFDAVVTDHAMPGGSGLALARWIRARPELAELPLIMLSGRADRRVARELTGLGGAMLAKPVDVELFLATIERFLGRPAGSSAAP